MITIVDYGLGNLGSVENMLRHLGIETRRSGDPEVVRIADKLILPGVGAFDRGMENLRSAGLIEALDEAVRRRGAPLLGICLGMQLLMECSEEGREPGLGWVPGAVRRFAFPSGTVPLKVPHMGWNVVEQARPTPLFEGMYNEPRFYFVHSYHVYCTDQKDVMLTTDYGYRFASGISRENIFGVQFHPEKSHKFGMQLIRQFASI